MPRNTVFSSKSRLHNTNISKHCRKLWNIKIRATAITFTNLFYGLLTPVWLNPRRPDSVAFYTMFQHRLLIPYIWFCRMTLFQCFFFSYNLLWIKLDQPAFMKWQDGSSRGCVGYLTCLSIEKTCYGKHLYCYIIIFQFEKVLISIYQYLNVYLSLKK